MTRGVDSGEKALHTTSGNEWKVPALINPLFWATSGNLDEEDKNLLLFFSSFIYLVFFNIVQ